MALDQTFGFEHTKTIGKHSIAYVGDGGTNGRVPGRTPEQGLNNRPGPTTPDQLHSLVEALTNSGDWLFHGINLVKTVG